MNLVFAGGGTAGHIFPGLAVAKKAVKVFPSARVLFLTDSGRGGTEFIAREGFDYKFISCGRVKGKNALKLPPSLAKTAAGVGESVKILKKFKADVIIGTGGYVSAPVLAAGMLTGTAVILLEQNYVPGLTTRIFSRFANEVELSFPGSGEYLSRLSRCRVTGNPVREEIISARREHGLEALGLSSGKQVIAVFGGSSGAHSINLAMERLLAETGRNAQLREAMSGWQVVHVTGERDYARMEDMYARSGVDGRVYPFVYRVDRVYGCADLVVARSGGNTVAEVAARGIAAIYAPYPHAADNHQELNARWVESAGGCIVVKDGELCSGKFRGILMELMTDRLRRLRMAEAAGRLGIADAAERITGRIAHCLRT